MKENKYDESAFFKAYSDFPRSKGGLKAAGEWHVLQQLLPDFSKKSVLDLGCGLGWHCRYAAENGASHVVGTDISKKMLSVAKEKNLAPCIKYECAAMEDVNYPDNSFDIAISSLALHYIEDIDGVFKNVSRMLKAGGSFIFSAEHPVFTSYGTEDWYRDKDGNPLHWPLDNYYIEGSRQTTFLSSTVIKYHKTLTTYFDALINNGFQIVAFKEPTPPKEWLCDPMMKDELRRPMMFIISAKKI